MQINQIVVNKKFGIGIVTSINEENAFVYFSESNQVKNLLINHPSTNEHPNVNIYDFIYNGFQDKIFSYEIRSRGNQIYRSSRILSYETFPDHIDAVIQGSTEYKVSITLKDGIFTSTCTCPFVGHCKHVSALITLIYNHPEFKKYCLFKKVEENKELIKEPEDNSNFSTLLDEIEFPIGVNNFSYTQIKKVIAILNDKNTGKNLFDFLIKNYTPIVSTIDVAIRNLFSIFGYIETLYQSLDNWFSDSSKYNQNSTQIRRFSLAKDVYFRSKEQVNYTKYLNDTQRLYKIIMKALNEKYDDAFDELFSSSTPYIKFEYLYVFRFFAKDINYTKEKLEILSRYTLQKEDINFIYSSLKNEELKNLFLSKNSKDIVLDEKEFSALDFESQINFLKSTNSFLTFEKFSNIIFLSLKEGQEIDLAAVLVTRFLEASNKYIRKVIYLLIKKLPNSESLAKYLCGVDHDCKFY